VLELRSATGAGGGPEKTILAGAATHDPERFAVTVCYLRNRSDADRSIAARARAAGVDFVTIDERHSLDPAPWHALTRLVRQRQIDIVHAHDHKSDLLALCLGRSSGVVPISTAHGWTGHSRRERYVYYPADRRLLTRFPHVVAVSSDIRARLLEAGADPSRVSTILNGVDHRAFRRNPARREATRRALGLGPADVVIGSFGRLEPQKRYDILIDVCAGLARAQARQGGSGSQDPAQAGPPSLKLLIAGDGSLARDLAAQAAAVMPQGCRLLGHRADVADVMSAFDLFVQSSDYEGTPNAVLEAMAVETPVVATTAGGTGELIADEVHGLLVPCGVPGALRNAIERTLADPDAARTRASAARQHVEQELSFERRMKRLEAVYERMYACASSS
jgi:glycosyltransferase involved in cell wall biosynthesis